MKYSTVYVGMDVHKKTFSLCCYTNEKEKAEYPQKVEGHYSKVIVTVQDPCDDSSKQRISKTFLS